MIEGIATTPTISANNNSLRSIGCELAVPIPLMFSHEIPVGEVVYMRKSETEVYIRAVILDDIVGYDTWQLIKCGELKGLSCAFYASGGQFHCVEINGIDCITRFKLKEVSLCFEPANPDCYFRIYPGGSQKMVHPSIRRARETLERVPPWLKKYRPTVARLKPVATKKSDEWFTPLERRRFESWLKKSQGDDHG
jgi:hypothetical protein